MNCTNCKEQISEKENFCPHCGAPVKKENGDNTTETKTSSKTISSSGSYSGTMVKGNKSRKIFRNIIIGIVIIGIVAMIVWFQVDPDAGEKLTNILVGLGLMAVFAFFIYQKSKKGKGRRRGRSFRGGNRNDDDRDDDQHDQYDDDDYDDDDDDDGGDDD